MSDDETQTPDPGNPGSPEHVPSATSGATPPAPEGFKRPTTADLPPEALTKRLEVERKRGQEEARKALLAELGIEDPNAFKTTREQQQKELQQCRQAEEKRKREQLSERERLLQDIEAEKKRAAEAETKLRDLQDQISTTEQQQMLESIASKHIHGPFVRAVVSYEFRQHIKALQKTDPNALNELDEKAIDRWFRDFARENADYQKREEQKEKEAPKEQPKIVRRPITTGRPVQIPTSRPVDPTTQGKTFRPNQPNSMTRAEVKEALAKQGIKYPT